VGGVSGELSRYNDVLYSACSQPLWSDKVVAVTDALTAAIVDTLQQTTKAFLQEGELIVTEKVSRGP
jgi:hypothetical protein